MSRKIDLTGQRFGRLTAIKPVGGGGVGKHIIWLCRCECGNLLKIESNNLKRKNVKSCGCWRREQAGRRGKNCPHYKHGDGEPRKRLYRIWANMITRCNNSNERVYHYYGERGIQVCSKWKNNYSAFKAWALMNGYQDNLTIDRIDNDGNYEPNNCQWITRAENSRKGNKKLAS